MLSSFRNCSMPLSPQVKLKKTLQRFRRGEHGSAAIEFAMVALPFFGVLIAIFEYALMFFAGQMLETMTQDTARLLFTNQAQTQGFDAKAFKDKLCAEPGAALFDCQGGVSIDVQVFPQFSAIPATALADPIDANGNFKNNNFSYSNPAPGSTVVVRTYYQWPLLINIAGYSLANLAGGNKLLSAIAAFRVEPGAT